MPTKQPKKKPPIVTSKVPGHLNADDSAKDTERILNEWCREHRHQRGYSIAPRYWKSMFHALWFASMVATAPDSPKTRKLIEEYQQEELPLLKETMKELQRTVEYSEKDWVERGVMRFLGNDDERKMGIYLAVNPYIREK